MGIRSEFTFVVPANDDGILKTNFLSSHIFNKDDKKYNTQVIIQRGYDSASKAYNDAISSSVNDLIILCHQDMFFPSNWLDKLNLALDQLDAVGEDWGVIGCYGVTGQRREVGFLYCNANKAILGSKFQTPVPVQTLDEIVLIIKKSSGLSFDENLPYYHLYGTEICLQAMSMNKKCYAISAFCIHNSEEHVSLPLAFIRCYFMIRKKWKMCLPIYATCMKIERIPFRLFNACVKQLAYYLSVIMFGGVKKTGRASDPPMFLKYME